MAIWLAQLSALFVLTRWRPNDSRVFPYLLLGLAGTAAFFIKMTSVGLWIALVAAETLVAARFSQWSPYRRHIASLLYGAAATTTAVLAYLISSGGLRSFIQIYFAFNALYGRTVVWADRVRSLVEGVQLVGSVAFVCFAGIWILMLMWELRAWRRSEAPDLLVVLAVIWLPLEFAIATYAGHGVRYFSPALPALVLVFALACSKAAEFVPWAKPPPQPYRRLGAALLTLLVVGASISLAPAVIRSMRALGGLVVHREQYARFKPGATYAGSCYPEVTERWPGSAGQLNRVRRWFTALHAAAGCVRSVDQ